MEPVVLLLRQMPRFRGASDRDVAGRAFSDLSEFSQYRRAQALRTLSEPGMLLDNDVIN